MSLQFFIKHGPDAGRAIALDETGSWIVGRGSDATMQLTDPSMSRKHVRVECQAQSVTITDLGSSAGTLVNDQPATTSLLKPGDTLRMGDTLIVLRVDPVDASTLTGGRPPGVAANLADLVGRTIHTYEFRQRLADGRSGAVFKAWDTHSKREVAVKVLWPTEASCDEAIQRFVRAMKTMFQLRHPNVIQIYNAGRNDGLTWIAMEYFKGESLSKVIQRIGTAGMLDWRTGFRIAVQIARALDAAYEKKIIHRNITPSNILFDSKHKIAKLSDLMLAKALEGSLARQVTEKGKVVGDLAYLSPERLETHEERIDCRSDIYSLGATVYALLTGRPPLEAASLAEMLPKVRNELPERPKRYQLSISDMFEGAMMRMLEKRPEERYQTPADLLRDLERIGKYQGLSTYLSD